MSYNQEGGEGWSMQTRHSSRIFGRNITNYPLTQLQDRKRSRPRRSGSKNSMSLCWSKHPEVAPYMEQMSKYTCSLEHECYIRDNYMTWHSDINTDMRQVLVGWLVQIYHKLELKSHTLYLAVFMLDKYCHNRFISRVRYQLLGLTALFVAAKYEEVKTPKLKHYAAFSANQYSGEQILQMESDMLLTLNFNVKTTTSCWHLEEYIEFAKFEKETKQLCFYILDLSIVEFNFCLMRPSQLSWGIILYVSHIKNNPNVAESQILQNSNLTSLELSDSMNSIISLFKNRKHSKFYYVNEKYSPQLSHIIS